MSPVILLTNEPHYDVAKEGPVLGANTIASLLERTKQKWRGESLKTLLKEAQSNEKNGQPAKKESSSEDEAIAPNSSGRANGRSTVAIHTTCV